MRVSDDAAGGQRFWRELAFALERAGIEVNARRNSPDPARAQVRRALAGIRFRVILVIDGFERVTEDSLDTALLEIVRDSPMLRLVVSLRSWRHFRPMQYVDVDAVVIDATDLLFVHEETAALLYEAGVEVAPAVAARIHREVLGRPEPVRAIALRLMESGGGDNAAVAKQVAADYMRDRLLPAVGGRDIFEFVLAISLVDPVPLGLADSFVHEAAGEGPSALALLEVLERQGFLQRSADGVSPIFHWPPLSGRDAFTAALERRDPDRATSLRELAARWYVESNDPAAALKHAAAAPNWQLVVEIIENHWRQLLLFNRDLLLDVFTEAPAAELEANRVVTAIRALRLQIPDDIWLTTVQKLPSDQEQIARLTRSPEIDQILDLGLISLLGLRQRGLFTHALAYAGRLEALTATSVRSSSNAAVNVLPDLLLEIGVTRIVSGDLQAAQRPLLQAYDSSTVGRPTHVSRDAAAQLALVAAISGRSPEAELWLERHSSSPNGDGGSAQRANLTAAVADAIIAIDRLDMRAAHDALAEADLRAVDLEELWAFHLYAQVLYHLHDGRPEQALSLLTMTRGHHPSLTRAGSAAAVLLSSLEADVLVALGRANLASAGFREIATDHPLLQISSARLALLSNDAERAASITGSHNLARVATTRMMIELQLINAVAQHRRDRGDEAAVSFRKAVAAASPARLLRAFTTVPVTDLIAIATMVPGGEEFLATPALVNAHRPFTDTLALVQLTEREHLILSKLTENASIQEIGTELYLSRNTIKTHVRNLYRKLGANSREEAVERGHALGLL